jgi:hypothetical protein
MSIRRHAQRVQLVFPAALLLLAVLLSAVARGAGLASPPACASEVMEATVLPTLGGSPVRLILIRGVVEPVEEDFFGRPERVAIVFVTSFGFMIQNRVEDVAAGVELKDHVGEEVTVRGAILVKADGRPALLVDAFEVHGSPDEGIED